MKGAWVSKRTTPTLLNGLNSEGFGLLKYSQIERQHTQRVRFSSHYCGEKDDNVSSSVRRKSRYWRKASSTWIVQVPGKLQPTMRTIAAQASKNRTPSLNLKPEPSSSAKTNSFPVLHSSSTTQIPTIPSTCT